MGHRDLPPVLRKFGIALTPRVASDRAADEFRCQLSRHPERTQSAKDLARTTSTPTRASGCPTLVRVLCGQGGRRNPQPATPVPTARYQRATQPKLIRHPERTPVRKGSRAHNLNAHPRNRVPHPCSRSLRTGWESKFSTSNASLYRTEQRATQPQLIRHPERTQVREGSRAHNLNPLSPKPNAERTLRSAVVDRRLWPSQTAGFTDQRSKRVMACFQHPLKTF